MQSITRMIVGYEDTGSLLESACADKDGDSQFCCELDYDCDCEIGNHIVRIGAAGFVSSSTTSTPAATSSTTLSTRSATLEGLSTTTSTWSAMTSAGAVAEASRTTT